MKIVITIEADPDGPKPDDTALHYWAAMIVPQYVGSEAVDGTDKWGLLVRSVETEIQP